MAVADDMADALRAHFVLRYGDAPRCPMCGQQNWQIVGTREDKIAGYAPPKHLVRAQSVPVVVVGCANCFHVLTFAWEPIRKALQDKQEAEKLDRISRLLDAMKKP